MTALRTPESAVTPRPRHRRRLWWVLGAVTLVLALAGAATAAVALKPAPAPLALPPAGAPSSGPLAARWHVGPGSVAGFRVEQTVIGLTSEVVGRTTDLTGTAAAADGQVTSALIHIGLPALRTDGREPAPQFGVSLQTDRFPVATARMTEPVPVADSGAATTSTVSGELTLHGITRTVSATVTARRDTAGITLLGSVPVQFADFGIASPKGYGGLGSLADRGVAEFLLVLRRD